MLVTVPLSFCLVAAVSIENTPICKRTKDPELSPKKIKKRLGVPIGRQGTFSRINRDAAELTIVDVAPNKIFTIVYGSNKTELRSNEKGEIRCIVYRKDRESSLHLKGPSCDRKILLSW